MAWTTPRTWADGDYPSGTLLNTHLRDNLNALQDPARVQVYDNTGIVCANNTLVRLDFDTQAFDSDNMWAPGSPSRLTINTDGLYAVEFYVRFATGTFTELRVNLRKNSGGSAAGGTSIYTHYADTPSDGIIQLHRHITFPLTSGYYEFFVSQTSGGSKTTSPGNLTTGVTMLRLCP